MIESQLHNVQRYEIVTVFVGFSTRSKLWKLDEKVQVSLSCALAVLKVPKLVAAYNC